MRRVLFITTDQMRFDALGCNGGQIARTPNIDALAAEGVNYTRAHPQNVVCMPSRATMITGQHVATHGVWMNGVALPADYPNVAAVLSDAGYRTGLFGKSHFEPLLDPFLRFRENSMPRDADYGPHRGFERMELATHGGPPNTHYGYWMMTQHGGESFYYPAVDIGSLEVNSARGGDTDAPQVKANPMDRSLYHTDWVADRALDWLATMADDDPWFCWISFPDPHHPWDPPQSEVGRVNWRDLDLPDRWGADAAAREAVLDGKPGHWRDWYDGRLVTNYEAPAAWVPSTLTADQVREVNALTHVENELIDEALGRVFAELRRRGWWDDTDIVFTTDHGEFQGDYGLLFKGPYHVDSLMRLPCIWRPAPSAGIVPAVVNHPVGLVDLAPTFCAAAGVPVPEWMEGQPLPASSAEAEAQGRERVLTEWDSRHPSGHTVYLRSVYRDGFLATACEASSVHEGTEGELYDMTDDPLQLTNLWDDPARRSLRDDLVADLYANLPPRRSPRRRIESTV